MTRRAAGIVKDGKIVILSPSDWADGTRVVVETVADHGTPDIDGWGNRDVDAFVFPHGKPSETQLEPVEFSPEDQREITAMRAEINRVSLIPLPVERNGKP